MLTMSRLKFALCETVGKFQANKLIIFPYKPLIDSHILHQNTKDDKQLKLLKAL